MNRTLRVLTTTLAICLLIVGLPAQALTLFIGIDLSGSNPLVHHPNFGAMAGEYLKGEINKLSDGDVVVIKTFGARENPENLKAYRYEISRRQAKASNVAAGAKAYVMKLSTEGYEGQSSTNLLSWLEFTSGFDCANNGRVIVLTDGLESSSVIDGKEFQSGAKTLPAPEVDLTGCQITFWGIGAGLPHESVRVLRSQWTEWTTRAGATFTPITP